MNPVMIFLLGSVMGIDAGWTTVPDSNGERVYIIQLEPGLVDRLKEGEIITSIIDPRAGAVTQIRIQVGNGPLPRSSIPEAPPITEPGNTGPVFIAPPLPDDRVLEISESPQPVDPGVAPVETESFIYEPDENEPPVGDTRESAFDVPILPPATPVAPVPSLPGEGSGFSIELSSDEIQNTTPALIQDGAEDPGVFVPRPPVRETIPVWDEPRAEEPDVFTEEFVAEVSPANYDENVVAPEPRRSLRPAAKQNGRPWVPLTLTLMALLASLGGNAYLGFLFVGLYRRHRVLSNTTGSEDTSEDKGDVPRED